eukprot:365520-Chlamydomonas_euryale.AAC.2
MQYEVPAVKTCSNEMQCEDAVCACSDKMQRVLTDLPALSDVLAPQSVPHVPGTRLGICLQHKVYSTSWACA